MDLELNGEIDPDDEPREIVLSSGLRCLRDRGAVMRQHSKRQTSKHRNPVSFLFRLRTAAFVVNLSPIPFRLNGTESTSEF